MSSTGQNKGPVRKGAGHAIWYAVRACLVFSLIVVLLHAQAPPSTAVSLFQVTVGKQPVQLHEFGGGAFGLFEVTKPVDVEVRAGFAVRWVDIRPLSAGITPVISPDHSSVRFQLKSPVPLTVEFNGEIKRVIHLFAYAPEKDPPKPGTPNVRYFGPGIHEAGIMELLDGETIYLAPGSWVKGMVRSYGTKNIAIRGRGVLDAGSLPPRGDPALQAPGKLGTPPPASYGGGGRNVIYLEKTQGATVEGITLFNSPQWTLYLKSARGTHIDGVRILSWSVGCTTDGIDIVSSSDTLVENSFVRANDDCVAVKNMDNIDQSNITVRNSVFWNMPCGNAIEIGFETRTAKTEKVRFDDIDIIHVERGAAISIHHGDSAIIEDVVFNNIRVEDARHKLIDFALLLGNYGTDRPTPEQRTAWRDVGGAWDGVMNVPVVERAAFNKSRGMIRNIRVTNLHVVGGDLPFSVVSGFSKERPIGDIVIEGMQYRGRPIRNAAEGRFSVSDAPGLVFK
jgi:hypothetical protein